MPLLERVSTLLRANLNDLMDKAEDPEKLAKQIILDLENQLLQVKTQVAVAIADQHRLLQQQREHEGMEAKWRQKAELAVGKGEDDLARAALERSLSHRRSAAAFEQQHAEQTAETDTLRTMYSKLQAKLAETQARVEVLVAQHRRQRTAAKRLATPGASVSTTSAQLSRLRSALTARAEVATITSVTRAIDATETLEDRFHTLEQDDAVEALLQGLKAKQALLGS